MEIYRTKWYGFYSEAMGKIFIKTKEPILRCAETREGIKQIAEDEKEDIIIWEKNNKEGRMTEKLFTIRVGEKIHITKVRNYANKLAEKAEWIKTMEELKQYNGNLGHDD